MADAAGPKSPEPTEEELAAALKDHLTVEGGGEAEAPAVEYKVRP